MLRRILEELDAGSFMSNAMLARSMGVSEGLLEHMLRELTQRGYLLPLNDSSACATCRGCSSHGGCTTPSAGAVKAWEITAKGRRLLGDPLAN